METWAVDGASVVFVAMAVSVAVLVVTLIKHRDPWNRRFWLGIKYRYVVCPECAGTGMTEVLILTSDDEQHCPMCHGTCKIWEAESYVRDKDADVRSAAYLS